MVHKIIKTENYLLVVDDSEIKVGDWIRWDNKITKAVDTAYLPITKKIIAHLSLNHLPILKGVPLLPPIEDDVDELAFRPAIEYKTKFEDSNTYDFRKGYKAGYNKAKEKYKYTEDDMRKAWNAAFIDALAIDEETYKPLFFEDFIQSLHQHPTEFECEMVWTNSYGSEVPFNSYDVQSLIPKTITTTQGIQWVGKYK